MGKADYALMAEYHRGYEDGKAARAADEWALHQKRIQAMNRVDDYITNGYPLDDSPFWLPTLHGVIHALLDTDTYCLGDLVDGLKELLGADEAVKKPLVEYDVLGNERHKAICELRKLADAIDDGQWVGMDDLADALGLGGWISNPVRKLLQLFAGDEYGSCVDVHSERHDDALSKTIRNSNVYCAQPSATHELRAWVAKEVQPECWAKANDLADRIDDDVTQIAIDTRQSTYDFMCLEIDKLSTSMRNERQMYLDLLRDAARDYRSLQQADELRTHVLDAAIEENKSLRRKLREPDTPESIVRDLTLGNISESDAIKRIEKLGESE